MKKNLYGGVWNMRRKCKKQPSLNKETFKSVMLWLGVVACLFFAGCGEKSIERQKHRNTPNAKGQDDHVISDLNKVHGMNPKLAEECYDRGFAHIKQGEYDQAILDYTEAIQANPNYAEAYHWRGYAHVGTGEYDQAILDFTKAIEINPKYAEAYHWRAYAYVGTGEYDQAILDSTKAIEINPKYVEAYKNRIEAYCVKKEYDKAWEDVHKVQSLGYRVNPDNLKTLREKSGRER